MTNRRANFDVKYGQYASLALRSIAMTGVAGKTRNPVVIEWARQVHYMNMQWILEQIARSTPMP